MSNHLAAPILQLDLLKPECLAFVEKIIREEACVYVHFAPPCGTSSRARFIQRKGRYNPPVLRTDAHPNGIAGLSPTNAAKVASANQLYEITQHVCRLCHALGVLYSVENPARSFMWYTTHFAKFLQEVPHFCTYFHHCMYGSARRKHTCLVHNIATVKSMELLCNNDHAHEPWGHTDHGWATAQETAYPWPLARKLATLVALHLQRYGVQCPTPTFAKHAKELDCIRQQVHVQHSATGLPWVSEFAYTMQIPAQEPVPGNARLLTTPTMGDIASEGYKTIGVHRSPEEFMKQAIAAGHPGQSADELPGPMKEAVSFISEHSPQAVAQHRSEMLRKMIARSVQLAEQEKELKRSMSLRRQQVLESKRLLLFGELLSEAGSKDSSLVGDMCNGFDLTGKLPASNHFNQKFRPAALPTEALRGIADRARSVLLASVKSSGDALVDEGVLKATLKEKDLGFLSGPIDAKSIPSGATLTRRFGVFQRDKVRPIDDYKASLVNSAVTQVEIVTLHGIDHIACLAAALMSAAKRRGSSVQLVSKCWDLAAAYKQIPLSDEAYATDSYIVIYNPTTGKPEIYRQAVLPFGSIASVTAFLRCALGIWHIGSSLLKLAWTSYFDDFLSMTPACLDKHTELCVATLFQLLGWKLSADKLVPYAHCCKVLGVEVDLSRSPSGLVEVRNTESRQQELISVMRDILTRGFLPRAEGERLRGRLQFASNQLFGRRFRNCLKDLNTHISRSFRALSKELSESLELMVEMITENAPRQVDVNFLDWTHVYVDASFDPDGYSGIGGLILNSFGQCLGCFSEEVPQSLVDKLKKEDQKTVIFELEGLAIAAALYTFKDFVRGRRVVIFTDNQSAQACLIKCKSNNYQMNLIIRSICTSEEELGLVSWIERVPSQSNPADELSRAKIYRYAGIDAKQVDLLRCWAECTKEMNVSLSQVRGGETRDRT